MHRSPGVPFLCSLLLAAACGRDSDPGGADGGGGVDPAGDGGTPSACADDTPPAEDPTVTPIGCVPPPVLDLAAIPDDPSLDDGDPDTKAIFEVDGHQLIGKFVRDTAAAEGGLKLWQEITLRIPENQLRDLVQLDIYGRTDPTAIFNRTGDVTTERAGLRIGFSTQNFGLNDPDVCAPLVPHRGTFDWSVIHEFGHLRGWVDGSWPAFLTTFPHQQGAGDGYPADGSPVLDRDFVTSYAERSDGDEDHAESFTTFVMLPESAIPAPMDGEPLAATKVRWMSAQPGLVELRKALRVTEVGGGGGVVEPAPRLSDRIALEFPTWLEGTWQESPTDGWKIVLSQCDVVFSMLEAGVEKERMSLRELRDASRLTSFEVTVDDGQVFDYVAFVHPGQQRLNDSFVIDEDAGVLRFTRDDLVEDVELHEVE